MTRKEAINALIVKHGGTAKEGTVKELLVVLAKTIDNVTVSGDTTAEVVADWASKYTPAGGSSPASS